MLCYKLNNLPVHHCHTAMNLYEIISVISSSMEAQVCCIHITQTGPCQTLLTGRAFIQANSVSPLERSDVCVQYVCQYKDLYAPIGHTYVCMLGVHTHAHTHTCACTRTQTHMRARAHTHAHVHMHMHTHSHKHTHMCTCTHTQHTVGSRHSSQC